VKDSSFLCPLAIVGLLGFHTAALAQEPPSLSPEEQRELAELVERFEFSLPRESVTEQRIALSRLREYTAGMQTERLVVCELAGNPHLEIGDVVYLSRLGASPNLRMTVVRNEGEDDETHPWTNPGGGNVIIVTPAITAKPRFVPEGVGNANISPHDGDPSEHAFGMRRNTRVTFGNPCNTPPGEEDMIFFVPPHESGGRHGGHAVAN
jgi:hypothetical protein